MSRTILILLLFFGSCGQKQELQHYTDEQLIAILTDVHIANALVSKSSKETRDSLKNEFAQQLSQIHSLQDGALDSILDLVHLDISRYKKISAAVDDSITQLQNKLQIDKKR